MKKMWLKLFVFAFVLAAFAPMTGATKAFGWQSAGGVDGVGLYFRVARSRDQQLEIFWKAVNGNSYGIFVEITNRVYQTSVGTLSGQISFGFELKPNSSSEGGVPMNDYFNDDKKKIVVYSAQCNAQVSPLNDRDAGRGTGTRKKK